MTETASETAASGAAARAPTLSEHLGRGALGGASSTDLNGLLEDVADACRSIAQRLRRAALTEALGLTGALNVQGEEVQKLDEISNNTMIDKLSAGGACAAFASEELEKPTVFEGASSNLLVTSDPLDGSSNLDVAVSVGTIFGILRYDASVGAPTIKNFLQPGRRMVAAGYAVYGSSTVLAISGGESVHAYTLDPIEDEWYLTHENIRCKPRGSIYSINEGYKNRWDEGVRNWNAYVSADDKATGRPYSLRYVGSLVADAHRTLLKGGIFAYPADSSSPGGKLRLSYEACPFAFVFEASGGAGTDGVRPILDIQPERLHERTPLVIGSADDVAEFAEFATGRRV